MAVDRFYTKPPYAVDGAVAFAIDVNGVNNETNLAFTLVASELDAQVAAVSYWTLLAQDWAEEAEDVEVTVGSYSAYHWAQKADELGSVQVSLATDQVALAADQVALASRWSSENEDVAVIPGFYSAKHWSAKAEAFVSELPPGAVNDTIVSLDHTWSSHKISRSPFTYFFAQI